MKEQIHNARLEKLTAHIGENYEFFENCLKECGDWHEFRNCFEIAYFNNAIKNRYRGNSSHLSRVLKMNRTTLLMKLMNLGFKGAKKSLNKPGL